MYDFFTKGCKSLFETLMRVNVYKVLTSNMEENPNLLSGRDFKNITLYCFSPSISFILQKDVSQILQLWKLRRAVSSLLSPLYPFHQPDKPGRLDSMTSSTEDFESKGNSA